VLDAVSLQVNGSGCASWVRLPVGAAREDLLSSVTGNGVFSPPLATSVPSSSLSSLMSICPSTTGTPVDAVAELSVTHWALGYVVTVELSGPLLETRELVVRGVPRGVAGNKEAAQRIRLTDCTPQQLSVYTSTAGGTTSPAALVLCSEDLNALSINLITRISTPVALASKFATLSVGQQLAQAGVGAAMMAVDDVRKEFYFLGTPETMGAATAGGDFATATLHVRPENIGSQFSGIIGSHERGGAALRDQVPGVAAHLDDRRSCCVRGMHHEHLWCRLVTHDENAPRRMWKRGADGRSVRVRLVAEGVPVAVCRQRTLDR